MGQDKSEWKSKEIENQEILRNKYLLHKGYPLPNLRAGEEKVKSLQQPPGFPGFGPPRQDGFPGGQPSSGRDGMPMYAPPSFTPELPRDQRQFLNTPEDDSMERFGGMNQPRLRRCMNRFTFIWLRNGNSFWFFPIFIRNRQLVGFRWNGRSWVSDTINTRRIIYFQCF